MIRFFPAILPLLLVHGMLFSQEHTLRLLASDNKEIVFKLVYKSITLQSDHGVIKLTPANYALLQNKMIRLYNPAKPEKDDNLKTEVVVELRITTPDSFERHYWLPDELTGVKPLKEFCDKGYILLSNRKKRFM